MKKRNFNKLLVIFIGVIFTFTSILFLSSMYTISNSYAQEKTVNIGADKIKAMLLRPNGWIAEWNCGQGQYQGLSNLIFEDHGKKIVVKLHDEAFMDSCKRKVTITSDGFRMSGCYAGLVDLFYDPNDNRYPFKTKGDGLECDLKIRVK
jgi:hypothetical protein